jgi:hypothetical protein
MVDYTNVLDYSAASIFMIEDFYHEDDAQTLWSISA